MFFCNKTEYILMIISQERFVMKYEEFLELEKSQLTKNNFGVEMLKNKSPRTLVYGYTTD
jgi:hypothetical protein